MRTSSYYYILIYIYIYIYILGESPNWRGWLNPMKSPEKKIRGQGSNQDPPPFRRRQVRMDHHPAAAHHLAGW